jgi:hypothetical protein
MGSRLADYFLHYGKWHISQELLLPVGAGLAD